MDSPIEYDELSQLAFKYGTDKCPQIFHPYTPFYYDLFKDRKYTIKKVVEMGIGYWEMMKYTDEYVIDKGLNSRRYEKGASLKMWRDFFPNAQIYGGDKMKEVMFEDERIKTIVCDERKEKHLKYFIEQTGSDIDIFVDDASHSAAKQLFMCQNLMPLIQKDVIYIIEDIRPDGMDYLVEGLKDYDVYIPDLPLTKVKPHKVFKLLVVRHRK